MQCALVTFLTLPHIGATGYRDFHPLAIDTRTGTSLTMQGYVRDQFNERGIGFATVQLTGTGGYVATEETGPNGFFEFRNLDPVNFPAGVAKLTVEHIGYRASVPEYFPFTEMASIELQSRTVILLHGIAGSYATIWGGDNGIFHERLTEGDWTKGGWDFHVIGVDIGNPAYLGFPDNVRPINFAVDKFRLALETNCHQLGIQSYDVVGHSMGGLVGRSYATKSYGMNRINKLVTLATPHHGAFIANVFSTPGRALKTQIAALFSWLSFGQIHPDPADLPLYTALDDLRIGSEFLNALNYGLDHGDNSFNPCRSTFSETTNHYKTTIYSIAGTQPGGWPLPALLFLGCQLNLGWFNYWATSDAVVLKPRAFFTGPNSYKCTDVGLGCDGTHHKGLLPEPITKSEEMAKVVRELLKSGAFNCTDKTGGEKVEEGFIPSQLPRIEATIQPGTTYVDSTLINAISLVDFLCVSAADSLVYTLRSPSGRIIDPAECELDPDLEYVGEFNTAYYSIRNPESGLWKHQVTCVGNTEPQFTTIDSVFDGEVALAAETTTGIDPDGAFTLLAALTDAGLSIPTGAVTATVTRPDDTTEQIDLLDDGFGGDEIAADGVYTATYPAAGQAGTYGFAFLGETDPGGPQSEMREAMHVATAARLPDPGIADPGLVVDDTLVPTGGLIALTASFTNSGTASADSVLITLTNASYSVALAETLVVNMAPGQTIVLQTEWLALAEGKFALRAGIDLIGEQTEASFANNSSEVLVTVFVPGGVSAVPGDGGVDGPDGDPDSATGRILLYPSFPNPLAAGSTSIRFQIPQDGAQAALAVYDIRGRRVKTLVSESLPQGEHVRTWDGSDDSGRPVASGVYFYRLQVAGEVQIKKMVVVR